MKIAVSGINTVTKTLADKTKRVYYYHRASGKRLPDDPNSEEFRNALVDAERIAARDIGTVAGLIREYTASVKFERKAASTQREYVRMLTRIEERFGTMPIVALASPRVIGKFVDYQEEIGRDRPREGDNRLTVLSAVFSYAKGKGRIARNPLDGFERLYQGDRSEKIWTEADVLKFMREAPVELQRAMILAIHSGQRYGDLVRLRWSDYDGNAISLRQSKTSQRVWIKCTSALGAMLASAPKAQMEAAEMYPEKAADRLHFNDLRGTAVTLLAEAGATVPQIAAITGHTLESVTRILEKYLARTKALSEAAIYAFENAKETNFANRLQTSAAGAKAAEQKSVASQ
jgi:integrase